MSDKNNKNRLRKKSAPSYSEIPSGDVHPSILGSATDTAQTSKDADANIANVTKGAKNNIRKFLNNDFPINYSGGFRTVVVGLRQLLKLRYKGGSNYAKYQTPNGIFSFRLSDHNANGNNFENSEINISVYVAYHEYDVPESEVKYTEYKITPQLFENNPQSVVSAIVNGISKALNGESFSLDDSIATGDSFPKETPTDNNTKTESRKMSNKNTIILTESELKLVIAESVKRILSEEYDINEGRLGRALGTLALGGALALGGGNLKAQNMNHPQTVQMQQQNVEGFKFYAPQFKTDYEKLLSYTNSKGYSNLDRECAKDMLADFPLDRNGAIHLEYIITCDSGYDREKIMETSYDWFNYVFSSAEAAVSKYDTQNGIITARGSYANIGQFNLNAVYYAKVVRVGADTDVILRFKDNKVKIDVIIRNYRMISGESTMRSNNSLVNVADVYPANPNSDNKVAYARAFINSCSYSMDKVKKYIEFLNDNMNNEITNDDAAWEIGDRSGKGAKDMWDFNTPETMKQKYFEIQKQIQSNKKAMRSMEKNSEQQVAMKQKNDELRAEMQRLNQEYLKMTGQQIMQFEHPY